MPEQFYTPIIQKAMGAPSPEKARDMTGTLARIAGNLLSGAASDWMNGRNRGSAVREAVATAREILAEIKRTDGAA